MINHLARFSSQFTGKRLKIAFVALSILPLAACWAEKPRQGGGTTTSAASAEPKKPEITQNGSKYLINLPRDFAEGEVAPGSSPSGVHASSEGELMQRVSGQDNISATCTVMDPGVGKDPISYDAMQGSHPVSGSSPRSEPKATTAAGEADMAIGTCKCVQAPCDCVSPPIGPTPTPIGPSVWALSLRLRSGDLTMPQPMIGGTISGIYTNAVLDEDFYIRWQESQGISVGNGVSGEPGAGVAVAAEPDGANGAEPGYQGADMQLAENASKTVAIEVKIPRNTLDVRTFYFPRGCRQVTVELKLEEKVNYQLMGRLRSINGHGYIHRMYSGSTRPFQVDDGQPISLELKPSARFGKLIFPHGPVTSPPGILPSPVPPPAPPEETPACKAQMVQHEKLLSVFVGGSCETSIDCTMYSSPFDPCGFSSSVLTKKNVVIDGVTYKYDSLLEAEKFLMAECRKPISQLEMMCPAMARLLGTPTCVEKKCIEVRPAEAP